MGDLETQEVVSLFGACENGGMGGYPLRTLIAFEKVHLQPEQTSTVQFRLRVNADLMLGVEQQPLPGSIRFWVGDAQCRERCTSAVLKVTKQTPQQPAVYVT